MVDDENKDGFLSRWSRRKQASQAVVESGQEAEIEAVDVAELEAEQARLAAEIEEAEVNRSAAEAVDLDQVEYGFDFSIFLKRGVPDPLRKKALQKFFNSNPVLANLDGLNDYDEDFNNPLHMVYKSTWDVARGFLTQSEQLLQQTTGRLTTDEPLDEEPSEDTQDETAEPAGEAAELADGGLEPPEDAAELTAEEQTGDPGLELQEEVDVAGHEPDADGTSDPEPPQQKRISIRQRLNG